MELPDTIRKMMLSIKIQEGIPAQYHFYIKELLTQTYIAGWEQGRLEINQHGNKPIGQFLKGKQINEFKSLKEAAKKTGFSEKGIVRSMQRGTPMKQGWTWQYLEKKEATPKNSPF